MNVCRCRCLAIFASNDRNGNICASFGMARWINEKLDEGALAGPCARAYQLLYFSANAIECDGSKPVVPTKETSPGYRGSVAPGLDSRMTDA